jgi:hypothetical protein
MTPPIRGRNFVPQLATSGGAVIANDQGDNLPGAST